MVHRVLQSIFMHCSLSYDIQESETQMLQHILGNAIEIPEEDCLKMVTDLFVVGEEFKAGYQFFRDQMIFTNKRLILVNKQGMSGKKTELLSIPWRNVIAFSTENTGGFDLDSEIKILVKGATHPIIKKVKKGTDLTKVQNLLAEFIL